MNASFQYHLHIILRFWQFIFKFKNKKKQITVMIVLITSFILLNFRYLFQNLKAKKTHLLASLTLHNIEFMEINFNDEE